ncbi:Probable myosin-binding protein 4 [Striga hermonthica]|uniref:Probable myosin-binding protein 4 n=1 Tax=Striga hermonthica TaxID=68872 RepID=A0A9N7RG20_STRHE|nr:Probable myosin-binding protein 4 [Striga hermonthica]
MAAVNPQSPNSVTFGFMNHLSSAACEWLLILLLLVNSCLFHLLAKFARYCHLTPPCLLCSTLDTALLKSKPRTTYWNLLCNDHRQEMSCLVSCSVHSRFADVSSLCEECLSPIINHSKFTSDSYRLLVGKSWLDVDRSVLQSLVSNKHIRLGSPDHRTCSCCGKMWRAKSSTERLLELNPASLGASKANVKPPLPRAPGRSRFSRRDSLKRLRDKFTSQIASVGPTGADTLSHVGYTKLNISSDTESEFPFSEDDDDGRSTSSSHVAAAVDGKEASVDSGNVNLPGGDVFGEGRMVGDLGWRETHGGKASPSPRLSPDLISLGDWPQQSDGRSRSISSSGVEAGVDEKATPLDLGGDGCVNFPGGDFVGQERMVGDLGWHESHGKASPSPCLSSDLISLGDWPQQSDVAGVSLGPSALSVLSELLSLCNVPSSPGAISRKGKLQVEKIRSFWLKVQYKL